MQMKEIGPRARVRVTSAPFDPPLIRHSKVGFKTRQFCRSELYVGRASSAPQFRRVQPDNSSQARRTAEIQDMGKIIRIDNVIAL